jgi:hypothetical protein
MAISDWAFRSQSQLSSSAYLVWNCASDAGLAIAYVTVAVAKRPHARFPCVSCPRVRCSTSESPQDRSSSARRSRDCGVLSMPNFSGSLAALIPLSRSAHTAPATENLGREVVERDDAALGSAGDLAQ